MVVGIEPRTTHVLGKLADMCQQTRECWGVRWCWPPRAISYWLSNLHQLNMLLLPWLQCDELGILHGLPCDLPSLFHPGSFSSGLVWVQPAHCVIWLEVWFGGFFLLFYLFALVLAISSFFFLSFLPFYTLVLRDISQAFEHVKHTFSVELLPPPPQQWGM